MSDQDLRALLMASPETIPYGPWIEAVCARSDDTAVRALLAAQRDLFLLNVDEGDPELVELDEWERRLLAAGSDPSVMREYLSAFGFPPEGDVSAGVGALAAKAIVQMDELDESEKRDAVSRALLSLLG